MTPGVTECFSRSIDLHEIVRSRTPVKIRDLLLDETFDKIVESKKEEHKKERREQEEGGTVEKEACPSGPVSPDFYGRSWAKGAYVPRDE